MSRIESEYSISTPLNLGSRFRNHWGLRKHETGERIHGCLYEKREQVKIAPGTYPVEIGIGEQYRHWIGDTLFIHGLDDGTHGSGLTAFSNVGAEIFKDILQPK